MIQQIKKRNGDIVDFDPLKIRAAISKANKAGGENEISDETLDCITRQIVSDLPNDRVPTVEEIQDIVEANLISSGYAKTAKAYILYRSDRTRSREMNTRLMKIYENLTFKSARDSDIKRENANINGDTAMGIMFKYGSEGAKQFFGMYVIDPRISKAHDEGDIHIHDMDYYTLTATCCQIDLIKLFRNGFSSAQGHFREPQDISSYAALACIAIEANQNEMHGGQSVPNFDYAMAQGTAKTYRKKYNDNMARCLELLCGIENGHKAAEKISSEIFSEKNIYPVLDNNNGYKEAELERLLEYTDRETAERIQKACVKSAEEDTDKAVYSAMEAFIHNLNAMNSRAGAQLPFSSINYGTDTSAEGRMVIKNILLANEAGIGDGETPIFPIHIFKIKEGINYNQEDKNYDLFKLACRVSAKRLFPNFSFIDAPFNLKYYKAGDYNTEIATMGCRTRVIGNSYDPSREIVTGRGNLSFTSVNLPRLAIKANGNVGAFFDSLEEVMDMVCEQLMHRYRIQAQKTVRNFPFLMGQGVWIDSDKLSPDDTVGEVLKHGTLSMGFIGLAECLTALIGSHHGESEEARSLGMGIITRMIKRMDEETIRTGMNFSLLATPAEGLSGRFVRIDRKKFGIIKDVTDKDYYTNSFHVPVNHKLSAFEKIKIEAPYHELTNAGHISYVELDGDPLNNLDAFEKIVRCMKESGIGYGSINHPVDRDPVCGYTGIIGDVCPRCGRREEEHYYVHERIRRIGAK